MKANENSVRFPLFLLSLHPKNKLLQEYEKNLTVPDAADNDSSGIGS